MIASVRRVLDEAGILAGPDLISFPASSPADFRSAMDGYFGILLAGTEHRPEKTAAELQAWMDQFGATPDELMQMMLDGDSCRAAAASAVQSQARVVWIEDDPGSGKTALLRRAVAALPEGFGVTRAEADELASDVPLHLVAQLGVAGATAAFPAGLELLEGWGQWQDQGPVAVVIEDLQWADQPSRLALLCAVRRLGQDRNAPDGTAVVTVTGLVPGCTAASNIGGPTRSGRS